MPCLLTKLNVLPAVGGVHRSAARVTRGHLLESLVTSHAGKMGLGGLLYPLRLAVLKFHWTEPAWTSPFNYGADGKYTDGSFTCADCGITLFDGKAKFDSGSGWPSFWRTHADGAVAYSHADVFGRVECHCAKCGGHLGHVFDDGPPLYTTKAAGEILPATDFAASAGGLPRYCINGLAIRYRQSSSEDT